MTIILDPPLLRSVYHCAKRRRGGQPGNQNARKPCPRQGGERFYARRLSPADVRRFWDIVNTEGIEPAIAALLVRLRSSLGRDPANRRILSEASSLLARWYSSKYGLNQTDSAIIKQLIRSILERYFGLSPQKRKR